MSDITVIATRAIKAYQGLNAAADKVLPADIVKIVKKHGALAVGSSFIPVGGLDVAAATVNIWTMYIKINRKLGIKFSMHKTKSIVSAVLSNLVQNFGTAVVASGLKYTGVGIPAAIAIQSAALYALTMTSGWVYLKTLTNMALHDKDVDEVLKETMKDKAELMKIYDENKNQAPK